MNKKLITGIVLLLLGGIFAFYSNQPEAKSRSLPYRYEVKAEDVFGGKINLKTPQKKITIVDFWATWCPPCVAEIPHFKALIEKYPNRVQIIGISLDDSDKDVRSFYRKYQLNYPIAMAGKSNIEDFGDITSIPTTFILDEDMRLLRRVEGYRDLAFFESFLD